jgi:ribosomal small subunit protein bTHX
MAAAGEVRRGILNFRIQQELDMGRGDKRTRKGKTFLHSYGKTRAHDPNKKKKEAAAGAGGARARAGRPSR